jgi:hypothetical protein
LSLGLPSLFSNYFCLLRAATSIHERSTIDL